MSAARALTCSRKASGRISRSRFTKGPCGPSARLRRPGIAQRSNIGRRPSAFGVRAALQLHTIAPSSPLSHSASDLQLPEFLISLQSLEPMQAHLIPSPGVWKQLNSAPAPMLPASDAIMRVRMRFACRPPSNSVILVEELSDIVAEDQC